VCYWRSTIWNVLRRNGCSRRRRQPQAATRRYEWSRLGALLHVDTARLPAFRRPGHRVRGRSTDTRREQHGWGYVFVHAAVDDHSRHAHVKQHRDERGETCARFLERAIAHFVELGLAPPEAVMTDNALCYRRNHAFQAALAAAGARHIATPPYTWGYRRIVGELQNLGIPVSATSVRTILGRHGLPPAPQRDEHSWRDFLRQHATTTLACDFFTVETAWLQRIYVLFFISLESRRIEFVTCTSNPTGAWVTQQALWVPRTPLAVFLDRCAHF
jgi:hypothetical protein